MRLLRRLDREMFHAKHSVVRTATAGSGHVNVSGNRRMKESQAYPISFGIKVAELHTED